MIKVTTSFKPQKGALYSIFQEPEGVRHPPGWRTGDWGVVEHTTETLGMQGRIVAGPFPTKDAACEEGNRLVLAERKEQGTQR